MSSNGGVKRFPLPPKPPLPPSSLDGDWYAALVSGSDALELAGCRVKVDAKAERARGYGLILDAAMGRLDADITVVAAVAHDYWLGEKHLFAKKLQHMIKMLRLVSNTPRLGVRVASIGGTIYGRPGVDSFPWGFGWERYAGFIKQLSDNVVAVIPADGLGDTFFPLCRSPRECGLLIRSGAYFLQAQGIPVALYTTPERGARLVEALLTRGDSVLAREGLLLLQKLLLDFSEMPQMVLTRRSLYKLVRLAATEPGVTAVLAAKTLEALSRPVEAVGPDKLILAPLHALPHLYSEFMNGEGAITIYCCSQELRVTTRSELILSLQFIDTITSSVIEGVYEQLS